MHYGLQLSPSPRSMIFLCFLSHPLLSFATFSLVYVSFYIPEDSNLMQFPLSLLCLYVMCIQSTSIFFFYLIIYDNKQAIKPRIRHLLFHLCFVLWRRNPAPNMGSLKKLMFWRKRTSSVNIKSKCKVNELYN